jgi:hypothetical protein
MAEGLKAGHLYKVNNPSNTFIAIEHIYSSTNGQLKCFERAP